MCAAKRILAISAALIMTLTLQLPGSLVYGAASLDVVADEVYAVQGESKVDIIIEVTNSGSSEFQYNTATLSFDNDASLTITGGVTDTSTEINAGGSNQIAFKVDIGRSAATGTRHGTLTLSGGAGGTYAKSAARLIISESLAEKGSSNVVASVDIAHTITPSSGLEVGSDNTITFELFNKGNTSIKNALVTVTLPEGISVYNDSTSINIGYLTMGNRRNVTFPLTVDDTAESKNYPITVEVSGLSGSNAEVSTSKTFYIPVNGGNATASAKNLTIQNISVPSTATANNDFTVSFAVKNSGTTAANNMKVSAELPDGLLNKTATTFVENTIAAGETKTYSVTIFANKGGDSFPIKLSVAPLSGSGSETLQYINVFVSGDGSSATTPQLMVDRYTYGGTSAQAGTEFSLNLGLYNTSGKTLNNIKVSLSSDDGTFVPVDSSNAFFVESISAKGHFTKSVRLNVKPDAEQKTTGITISMSYEDSSGTAYSASDTISIPVTQNSRLVVDDMVPPYEIYVGEFNSAEIDFYNMGKTTLNNLRVNAEGDFDSYESNSYYAGNMASGSSDSYSFTFIPRQVGPVTGTIIFTYEDASLQEQTIEVPFEFEAMEMPVWDESEYYEEPEAPKPWGLIIGGSIIVLLAVGLAVWRKLRKAKQAKALAIADEAFLASMDIENGEKGGGASPAEAGESVNTTQPAEAEVQTEVKGDGDEQ